MNNYEKTQVERIEHECGLIRVQALSYGEAMMDRVDLALGPAVRLLDLVRTGTVALAPMVERDIETSLREARALLGVGK